MRAITQHQRGQDSHLIIDNVRYRRLNSSTTASPNLVGLLFDVRRPKIHRRVWRRAALARAKLSAKHLLGLVGIVGGELPAGEANLVVTPCIVVS